MLIMPAIDLIGGRCVRLLHGRFDRVTHYGDPLEQIRAFADIGAEWVHVVDLDGARAGAPSQTTLVGQLARATKAKIQCGGGIRTAEDIAGLLTAGAARVVIGSAAARAPAKAREWLSAFGPERICCALDVRAKGSDYEVAAEAWREGAGAELFGLIDELRAPLVHVLVTDISRDGAMTGPNTALIGRVACLWPRLSVQASGGVASFGDLAALRAAGASAAIVGRALYEGAFSLEAALAC